MQRYQNYELDTQAGIYRPPNTLPFAYSDGLAEEQRLLENLRASEDNRVFSKSLKSLRTNWPTNYHLSPVRGNLLRPFAKELKGSSILEIGAGCGAITRFAAELGASVTSLEGSPLRATITATRCRGLPNVRVIADNFINFKTTDTFDVVTLIGVLEYAQLFMGGIDPVCLMLDKARSFLKPGGFLLLAIENQLGLKYFCGAPEDHIQKFAFGINDSYSDSSVITFGRVELEAKLGKAGFSHTELFLPFPDYKLPSCILHPDGLKERGNWHPGSLVAGSVLFEAQPLATSLFSLEQAWKVVARNGLLPDLANSFLFKAYEQRPSKKPQDPIILASHYGSEKPEDSFTEKVFVEMCDSSIETRISETPIPAGEAPPRICKYYPGELHGDALLKLMNTPGWGLADIAAWAKPWVAELKKHITQTPPSTVDGCEFESFLPENYVDAIPINLAVSNTGNALNFFDIELKFQHLLPFEFVVFRGLLIMIHRLRSCAQPSPTTPLLIGDIAIGVFEMLDFRLNETKIQAFLIMFNRFHNQVDRLPMDGVHPQTNVVATAKIPVRPF